MADRVGGEEVPVMEQNRIQRGKIPLVSSCYRNEDKRRCLLSFTFSLYQWNKQGIYAFLSFSQIYFRIHVSVLKLLFDKYPDVDVNVLEEHLQRASQGPFYHAEFDTDVGQGTVYRSESTTSGVCYASLYHAHTVLFIKEVMGASYVWALEVW